MEEVLDENLLPEDKVALSKSQSQTKKLGAVKMETLSSKYDNFNIIDLLLIKVSRKLCS